jgi:hypothetical protein
VYDAGNASVRGDAACQSRDGEGVERRVDQDPAVRISHPDDATDTVAARGGEFSLDAYIAVLLGERGSVGLDHTPRFFLGWWGPFSDQRRRCLNLCPTEGTSR